MTSFIFNPHIFFSFPYEDMVEIQTNNIDMLENVIHENLLKINEENQASKIPKLYKNGRNTPGTRV